MAVAFYISGHGFGHAVRQIEIINTFSDLHPSVPVLVRTSAPRWLLERTLRRPLAILEGEVDTGVVQRGSLALDETETIRRAAEFYRDLPTRADEEAALLRTHAVAVVVSDAPPLACVAARRAGARAAVCSNFTWDWIYAGYAPHLSEAPGLLDTLHAAYAHAQEGWRMPMHGGVGTVPAIADLPFVARRSGARSREEVRQALGLPCGRPLALVSFGGYGVEGLPIDRVDCTPDWGVIVTGRGPAFARSPAGRDRADMARGVFALDESLIYGSHLGYQDVVRAADVVITKPGYGIISDCVAAETAILYTSRGRFAEYDVLVAEMPRYLRCRFIDEAALRAGVWREALDGLLASPAPPERPRLDGADVAAGLIADRLEGA